MKNLFFTLMMLLSITAFANNSDISIKTDLYNIEICDANFDSFGVSYHATITNSETGESYTFNAYATGDTYFSALNNCYARARRNAEAFIAAIEQF